MIPTPVARTTAKATQELAGQPPARSTESGSNRHPTLPRLAPGQHEIGHRDAGGEEQEESGTEDDQERGPALSDRLVAQSLEPDSVPMLGVELRVGVE
jgi:hypothetical protein